MFSDVEMHSNSEATMDYESQKNLLQDNMADILTRSKSPDFWLESGASIQLDTLTAETLSLISAS